MPVLKKAVAMSDYGDTSATPALEWFALAVKPRFDKAVSRMLEIKGFETFLPLYKKRYNYSARSKEADLPLFPGYVFCRFDIHRRLPVLTTPGVLQILGSSTGPTAISEGEIFSLQTAMRAHLPAQPCPFLQTGQRVRISRGVLAGVEGIVIDIKHGLRLVLSVTLLQRSILLDLDREMVSAAPEVRSFSHGNLSVLNSSLPGESTESYQGD
jgi:transcription antitermination factor NusG